MGHFTSLQGVNGAEGRPLQLAARDQTFTSANPEYVAAEDNPLRVALILQNLGVGALSVCLGPGTANGIRLNQYGMFQIDASLPWTGQVVCRGLSADVADAHVYELSVQP